MIPTYSINQWKEFLQQPEVKKHISEEMEIIRFAQTNRIIQEAGDSRSVGQAQILNSLQKLDENDVQAKGPVFIYTHIPLNEQQKHAPNVKTWTSDIQNPF